MTQIYGVSYRRFGQELEKGFNRYKDKIQEYLIFKIEYGAFIKSFIETFWKYQRSLSLYKLREFFQVIVKDLSREDIELSWTVLDQSKININYNKFKERKLDFKENLLGRSQFSVYEPTATKNYAKIRNSAQANFIHSLDASINMYILEKADYPIFPIHDAWCIPLGKTKELQNSLSEIYFKIADNNLVLKKLIEEFVNLLSETVSEEAGQSFRKYCEEKVEIGNYNPSCLRNCKFMVYY